MKAKNVLILLLLVCFLVACATQPGTEGSSNQEGKKNLTLVGRTTGGYEVYRLDDHYSGVIQRCWIVVSTSSFKDSATAISCPR